MDASFVPKSGKHTYGLDRFWNSSHSRAEKGLEISTLAWLDVTDHGAYGLLVEQTPPSANTSDPEITRMDVYLDQLSRVVKAHDLSFLRYGVSDSAYSKQTFIGGVRALGLHQIGKLRADANRHHLYQGPKRPGPGRQKTYDGKVNWSDLSRFERFDTEDEHIVLYHHRPVAPHSFYWQRGSSSRYKKESAAGQGGMAQRCQGLRAVMAARLAHISSNMRCNAYVSVWAKILRFRSL